MRRLRVAVLSFALLAASATFRLESLDAQRPIGGRVGAAHLGGHPGSRARALVTPRRVGGFIRSGLLGPARLRPEPFWFPGFPPPGFGDRPFFGVRHHLGFFPFRHPFGFFGHPGFGFGFGALPLWYGGAALSPLRGAPPTASAPDTPPTLGRKSLAEPRVAVPGAGGAGDSLLVERISIVDAVTETGLRLTWKDAGQQAQEVALFLADSARNTLAIQTVRVRPYRALFQPPPGTAFAGMMVVWPDGSTASRVIGYLID